MIPSSFSSILQIVALMLLAMTDGNYHAVALDSEEYDVRVQRARLVGGVIDRHSNHHLRSGQPQKTPPGLNRQEYSDAEFISGWRLTKTLHIDLYNEQHENTRKQQPNNGHHQRRYNSSPGQHRQREATHNNLRKRTKSNHASDDSSIGDESKQGIPKEAARDVLTRGGPASSTATNTNGMAKEERN
jgi:hypothetical protein